MSCTCLAALLNALKPPWGELPPLTLPPALLQLSAMAGGLAGASAMANASVAAQLSAIAGLGLPALPIKVGMLAQISATATAVGQIKAIGIDPFGPNASAQLSLLFAGFNLAPGAIPSVGPLGPLFAIMAVMKASLGINLLAAGAAASLQASLNAMVSAAASLKVGLPALSLIASYSALAKAAVALGVGADFGAMAGRLTALLSLQIPAFRPGLLAQLLSFLATRANAISALGFDPFAVGMSAKLSAALAPLNLLASLKLSENLAAAAALGSAVGSANLSANFSAMASANLSALASLKLPNLAPAMMLSVVIGQARNSSACSSSCPGSRI
jgi:hypothetical protein